MCGISSVASPQQLLLVEGCVSCFGFVAGPRALRAALCRVGFSSRLGWLVPLCMSIRGSSSLLLGWSGRRPMRVLDFLSGSSLRLDVVRRGPFPQDSWAGLVVPRPESGGVSLGAQVETGRGLRTELVCKQEPRLEFRVSWAGVQSMACPRLFLVVFFFSPALAFRVS